VKEGDLLKASIIFSLIGILIIFYLTYTLEPTKYNIISLSKDNLDDIIQIKGIIESYGETPGLYLVTLKDDSGKITVVVFKDEELELYEGVEVKVIGQVVEYQDKLEIIAKEIVI
jgi:RecJ-like exonuclease